VDITVKSAGIAGHVVNTDGKPVSGAVVTVTSTSAAVGGEGHGRGGGSQDRSDPDGSFLVDNLEPGVYGVTVAAAGYRNAVLPPVTISNDSDVPSLDVRLEAGRSVRGRVLDANGNGIASAMVVAAPAGSTPGSGGALPASSDVNGTFIVTAPADGAIDLTAVAAGFPTARATGVEPQDGVDVVLRAPRPGHIRVSVLDAQGPVKSANVYCRAVPDYLGGGFLSMMNQPPVTDASGVTTVTSLAPGAYELTVASGARKATGSVSVTEGGEAVTTVTLP
jgi:protocatechuate 3,4-dioxygenase beta subunit